MVPATGAGSYKGAGRGYVASGRGVGGVRRVCIGVVTQCTDDVAELTGRCKAVSDPNVLSTSMEITWKSL